MKHIKYNLISLHLQAYEEFPLQNLQLWENFWMNVERARALSNW